MDEASHRVKAKCVLQSSDGYDAYVLALLWALQVEKYATIDLGEEGVILAAADVVTRVETRATLPDDDVACGDDLSAIAFHTKSFGF